MTKRFITDDELTIATAMVSDAMLRALPEPEECIGQFTTQFEEKIEKLKKAAARKASWKKFARSAVAAVLVILIAFSMLCVFNTEVRAAVVTWIKETFGTYTTYWFNSGENLVLPEYELTWIPEDTELISSSSSDRMCVFAYQCNTGGGFTLNYAIANENSQISVYSLDDYHESEAININGHNGDLYLSDNPDDPHALVWLDEDNNVVFIITSNLTVEDILHIANSIKLVK